MFLIFIKIIGALLVYKSVNPPHTLLSEGLKDIFGLIKFINSLGTGIQSKQ
jgi:hypothetical protein